MAHNILNIAIREISKGIKDDRTSIAGKLRYYEYLREYIDLEISRIKGRIKELSKERKREELENDKKIDVLLEKRRRLVLINQRKIDVLLNEEENKMKQFKNSPKKIEELKSELEGLDSKKRRLMIPLLSEQLKKLQSELKELFTV